MKRSNERGLAWPVLLCVAAAVLAGFGGAGCLGSHDDDDDAAAMDTSATDTSTSDTTPASDTTTASDTSTAQDTSSSSGIVDNSGLPSAPIAWSASSDMIVSLCGELAGGTVQLRAVAGQDCGDLEPMLRVENTHPSVRITARRSPTVVLEGTSTGTLVSVEEIDGAVPLDGDQASTFGVITFLMNATDGTTSVRLELPITNHDRQGLDNELPPAFEFHHAYEPSGN